MTRVTVLYLTRVYKITLLLYKCTYSCVFLRPTVWDLGSRSPELVLGPYSKCWLTKGWIALSNRKIHLICLVLYIPQIMTVTTMNMFVQLCLLYGNPIHQAGSFWANLLYPSCCQKWFQSINKLMSPFHNLYESTVNSNQAWAWQWIADFWFSILTKFLNMVNACRKFLI